MAKYKRPKVFDSNDMPPDVRDGVLRTCEPHQDHYLQWYMGEPDLDQYSKLVEDWLGENGAGSKETVVIRYWW